MMHFIYTKKWGNVDFKVWLTLIVISILSGGVFAYKAATKIKCPQFKVSAGSSIKHDETIANTHFVNEEVTFVCKPELGGDVEISWDFGDSTLVFIGPIAHHAFVKPGNYLVVATVNGLCRESINIHVIENSFNLDDASQLSPIIANDNVMQGDSVLVTTTATSKTYEWSILELPEMPKSSQLDSRFVFNKSGIFTIVLRLDNGVVFRKQIQVNELLNPVNQVELPTSSSLPPPTANVEEKLPDMKPLSSGSADDEDAATPEKAKVYQQLPDPEIKKMLEGVVDGKKNLEDFNNILCDGGKTKVMANGNSTKFSLLLEDLGKTKGKLFFKSKRKISSLKTLRDNNNGSCVQVIYIEYK